MQPQLIASTIANLVLKENSNPRNLPAPSSHILHKFADSNPHNEPWHYRSIIDKIKVLRNPRHWTLHMPCINVLGFQKIPKWNAPKL
jgi:hypothetical protein